MSPPSRSHRWRVGRHQPRNVYENDEYRLVCIGDEATARRTAQRIVDAMNDAARTPEAD